MLIWTFFLVLVCGTSAQSLSTPFSYTLYKKRLIFAITSIWMWGSNITFKLKQQQELYLQTGAQCDSSKWQRKVCRVDAAMSWIILLFCEVQYLRTILLFCEVQYLRTNTAVCSRTLHIHSVHIQWHRDLKVSLKSYDVLPQSISSWTGRTASLQWTTADGLRHNMMPCQFISHHSKRQLYANSVSRTMASIVNCS
jgi:hypothetical protein